MPDFTALKELFGAATTAIGGWWVKFGATVIEYLVIFALIVGCVTAVFYAGVEHGKAACANAQTHTVVKERDGAINAHNNEVGQIVLIHDKDMTTVLKLEADKAALQNKITSLKGQIDRYVQEDIRNRPLTVGAVGLLHDAATPASAGGDAANSDLPAGGTDGADQANSPVTWGDFFAGDLNLRGLYVSEGARCDKLRDWVKEHPAYILPSTQPSETAPSK